MRVLHVETGRHRYGGAVQVLHLVRGLVRRDIPTLLLAPRGAGVTAAARSEGLPVRTAPFAGEADLRFPFVVAREARRFDADVVHLHSRRGADTLGLLGAKASGRAVVLSRRVDNPERAWLARAKYALPDRVVAISDGIRRVLLAEGVPAERVVTVRSATDPGRFTTTCDRADFRRRLDLAGLPEEARFVGVVAQLIERKGHGVLLDALPAVLADHPGTVVLVFGRGPLREPLEARVRREGLEPAVRFVGFREDLPALLPCLDLVAHPAFAEGLGVALLEAAASGVPVVAGRAGGIPEVVLDGETGLLVEPGDVEGLGRALRRLLADEALRREMGRRARAFVERERSVDAMVEGNLAVYRGVVAARSRSR